MSHAIPPFDRLLARCEWRGDCLVFTGYALKGYGMFRPTTNQHDRQEYVHRWLYATTIGSIPDGWEIDHVKANGCRNTRCINPAHLEAVTPAENQRREARAGNCPNGHDQDDPTNWIVDRKGRRRGCKICNRDRSREYQRDKARRLREQKAGQ